ncbi:transposase family protein [Streptomyces sp. NBC_01728]|uniref:hypothetical protein n=1 Tax=unclassified Streptomyces TaxID=2593676 RepID=UPI0022523803|nr:MULTISPECIES: hypothetical protein [unclassified Streptomyces]MCX4460210.1 transposase family protein [Streptomyces sp. NBC_01719]MCX4500459.1 transposase family protein [Streptomyces sp. NBC_01728]
MLEQLGSTTDSLSSSDVADLRHFLILVADPHDVRGLRYPALALLCAAVSAVLTGARPLIAISEWITDAPQHALGVLGFAADPLTGLRTGAARRNGAPPATPPVTVLPGMLHRPIDLTAAFHWMSARSCTMSTVAG